MSDTRIAELEAAQRPVSSLARNLARLGLAALIVTGLVGCKSAVKLDEGAPVESRDAASAAAVAAALAAPVKAASMGAVARAQAVPDQQVPMRPQATAIRSRMRIVHWPNAASISITTATLFATNIARPSTPMRAI